MTTTTVDDLYARSPGVAPVAKTPAAVAGTATPQEATAASTTGGVLAQAKNAAATGYTATTQEVPAANLASNQLNDITSQDSPLMKRARQEGILSAAKRGLQNTSIAAGASEGAMADRATPLAQQNASQLQEQSLTNQAATNTAAQVSTQRETDTSALNAQLGTQTSQFNSDQQNQIAKLNAQMKTAVSQGNAEQVNQIRSQLAALQTQTSQFNSETTARANEQNAAAENQMRNSVMTANADLNKQYLAGTQAMDLASIQGRYQQLISSNQMASDLYKSYFDSIAQSMANKDIAPDRIAQYVNVQQDMLESGLKMMDQMNGTDLTNFQLPAVKSTGSGKTSGIVSTPAGNTPQPVSQPAIPKNPVPGNGIFRAFS